MRLLRVAVLLALCLVAGVHEAHAEGPPARAALPLRPGDASELQLRTWLESGDDVAAAWAAHEARERDLIRLGEAVADRFLKQVRLHGATRRVFLEALLIDAALHLGTDLHPESLTWRGWTLPAVTVYLCLRPAGALHLTALQGLRTHGLAWLALGGHMHAAQVPPFARRVLERYALRRVLRIRDQGPPPPVFRGPSGSVPGSGFARIPAEYPPVPMWHLSRSGTRPEVRLCGAPFPVHAWRSVARDGIVGFGVSGAPLDVAEVRFRWLERWVAGAVLPGLPPTFTHEVVWTGGRQAWRRPTTAVIQQTHAAWRAWRDVLLQRGILTLDLCDGLAPSIRWALDDRPHAEASRLARPARGSL